MGTDKEPAAGKEFNVYVNFDTHQIVSIDEFKKIWEAALQFQSLDLENNALVPQEELLELMAQVTEYKGDIVEMVNVFRVFAGLFNGKGVMSVVPVITKMMKDKNKMAELSGIVQIIEKYTPQNPEING